MALQPLNINGCNGCRIYYRNGRTEDVRHKADYILKHIAAEKHTSLKILRDLYRELTPEDDPRQIPVLYSESRIFVPFSMPVLKANGAAEDAENGQGFISLMDFETCNTDPDGKLFFTFRDNRLSLRCSYQAETVKRLLERAWKYREAYRKHIEEQQETGWLLEQAALRSDRHINPEECEPLPETLAEHLSHLEYRILQVLIRQPDSRYRDLAEILGCSYREIAAALAALRRKNIIYRVGSCKSGYWKLSLA